jgi:hypothetical protein
LRYFFKNLKKYKNFSESYLYSIEKLYKEIKNISNEYLLNLIENKKLSDLLGIFISKNFKKFKKFNKSKIKSNPFIYNNKNLVILYGMDTFDDNYYYDSYGYEFEEFSSNIYEKIYQMMNNKINQIDESQIKEMFKFNFKKELKKVQRNTISIKKKLTRIDFDKKNWVFYNNEWILNDSKYNWDFSLKNFKWRLKDISNLECDKEKIFKAIKQNNLWSFDFNLQVGRFLHLVKINDCNVLYKGYYFPFYHYLINFLNF